MERELGLGMGIMGRGRVRVRLDHMPACIRHESESSMKVDGKSNYSIKYKVYLLDFEKIFYSFQHRR